jgi:hypothetical protein
MLELYKGYNGRIAIDSKGITITRGIGAFLLTGKIRGQKFIPFSSITGIQTKKSGLTTGFVQFVTKGSSESKSGLFDALKDENTVTFQNNDKIEEIRLFIQNKISDNTPLDVKLSSNPSKFADLEKLAELRDKNIITLEEFETKKTQILNLN